MQSPASRALVIDDDPAVLTVLSALLRQAAIDVAVADSAERGFELLTSRRVDVVITDLRMPGLDGMDVLTRISRSWPSLPVVMLTAHGSVPSAVQAMRQGAVDFIEKPFERTALLDVVERAIARTRGAERTSGGDALLGASPPMRELRQLIARVAAGPSTVLVRGETGTGKELAARMLHERSDRRNGPFVRVHCAALPDTLLESELFGHEAGAFTGAARRKPGRVELAKGGTLFLDEIGDVTPHVQVKLLNLLQEREFSRLGGTETLRADVRFVAATHRDLETMVRAGEFREDLYYRLNVVPIWCPTLRERPGDIELLAESFVAELGAAAGRRVELGRDALALLASEPWPGNVRQLKNFVERLVVLSEGPILDAADVARELDRQHHDRRGSSPPASGPEGVSRLESHRRSAEKKALVQALEQARGNRALAARILGVSRRTLYNKLEKEGLI